MVSFPQSSTHVCGDSGGVYHIALLLQTHAMINTSPSRWIPYITVGLMFTLTLPVAFVGSLRDGL